MKLSVIILNYNVRFFLELCIQSVLKATNTISAEIIVIDNNSSDDSCKMVKSKFPQVKLIENSYNAGFSKANNLGVSEAKGEFICILNPDTIVPEDCFEDLLSFIQNQKGIGVVGCKLVDGRGQFLPESKRNIPSPGVALKKILGIGSQYYATQIGCNAIGEVPILVGAFMFLKRDVFLEVGGFDEDYFMYGEDVDLSYKILKAGYKNFYYGQTSVIHFKGESTFKNSAYAKRFYGAMQIFYKKHFKRNRVFDFIVYIGIKLAPYWRTRSNLPQIDYDRVIVFSNSKELDFGSLFQSDARYKPNLDILVENKSLFIYDTTYYSFKSIISHIENHSGFSNLYNRFLPHQGNFVVGSDSAEDRGEVRRI